jgi:hypothetical protein
MNSKACASAFNVVLSEKKLIKFCTENMKESLKKYELGTLNFDVGYLWNSNSKINLRSIAMEKYLKTIIC